MGNRVVSFKTQVYYTKSTSEENGGKEAWQEAAVPSTSDEAIAAGRRKANRLKKHPGGGSCRTGKPPQLGRAGIMSSLDR